MIVKVTVKDIRKGKRNEATRCPVALAIKRQIGSDRLVVYEGFCFIGNRYNLYDYRITQYPFSRHTRNWIHEFDKTGKGKPFSFILKGLKA